MTSMLKYYDSRWRHLFPAFLYLYLLNSQYQVLLRHNTWGHFSVFICFLGPQVAWRLWRFFDRRPRLELSDAGMMARYSGLGLIRWEDILTAYNKRSIGAYYVCLRLRDEPVYAGRLFWLRRKLMAGNVRLGFTPLFICLSNVRVDSEQLLTYILTRATAAQAAAAVAPPLSDC